MAVLALCALLGGRGYCRILNFPLPSHRSASTKERPQKSVGLGIKRVIGEVESQVTASGCRKVELPSALSLLVRRRSSCETRGLANDSEDRPWGLDGFFSKEAGASFISFAGVGGPGCSLLTCVVKILYVLSAQLKGHTRTHIAGTRSRTLRT